MTLKPRNPPKLQEEWAAVPVSVRVQLGGVRAAQHHGSGRRRQAAHRGGSLSSSGAWVLPRVSWGWGRGCASACARMKLTARVTFVHLGYQHFFFFKRRNRKRELGSGVSEGRRAGLWLGPARALPGSPWSPAWPHSSSVPGQGLGLTLGHL